MDASAKVRKWSGRSHRFRPGAIEHSGSPVSSRSSLGRLVARIGLSRALEVVRDAYECDHRLPAERRLLTFNALKAPMKSSFR